MKLYLLIPFLSLLSGVVFTAHGMENPPTATSAIPTLTILAARPLYKKMQDDQAFTKFLQANVHKIPKEVIPVINNAGREMMGTLRDFIATYKHIAPALVVIKDLKGEKIYLSDNTIGGDEILIAALEQKRQDIARILAQAGMPPTEFYKSLQALFKRHQDDKYSLIKTFLDFNLISLKDKYENWPLMCLAAQLITHRNQPCQANSIINALLVHGCDPNAREDLTGKTPLMLVCENGCAPCARELIKKGAHIEATDDEGKTAVVHAVANNKVDAFKVLVENRANTDATYKENSLFDYAKSQRYSEILRVMRIAKEERESRK